MAKAATFVIQKEKPKTKMETIGSLFIIIGVAISFIYGILLLIRAFQAGLLWGLGYIFIPFVSFIFIIVHWETAKSPFLKGLLAIPFLIVGMMLTPESY